eukprot:2858849-Rhodomonas_salina.1
MVEALAELVGGPDRVFKRHDAPEPADDHSHQHVDQQELPHPSSSAPRRAEVLWRRDATVVRMVKATRRTGPR